MTPSGPAATTRRPPSGSSRGSKQRSPKAWPFEGSVDGAGAPRRHPPLPCAGIPCHRSQARCDRSPDAAQVRLVDAGRRGRTQRDRGQRLDQWRNSPPEWGTGAEGFARRWVSDYAESAIGDGAKYAVAHFFHQDPSFTRCECSGFGRRLRHAVDSPFMARKRDGTRVPSAASLAGALTGHVVRPPHGIRLHWHT